MKKLICTFLAVVMLFSMAALPAAAAEEDITLTFWTQQNQTWIDSYRAVADEFHELHPNITIKFESFPYTEFQAKIQTSLISGTNGADIYELWGGWGLDFCSAGVFAPIPDDMADEIMTDAYSNTYGALLHEGKLYGMPMEYNIECGGMLVNLKLLEEAGLEIPTTWDELVENAKKLTVGSGETISVKGFDFADYDGIPYLFLSMIMSQGGSYLNEDGTFNFTSEEAKSAFQEMMDLILVDQVTNLAGITGGATMGMHHALYMDQTAMLIKGPWVVADGTSTFGLTYGEDYVYAALPWFGDEVSFPSETGWSLAVNAASKNQEAAFMFLDYFFSDEVILKHNIACGQIPAKRSVAESPEIIEQMPFLEPLIGILDKAQFIGYFNSDILKFTICNIVVDYCTGGIYDSVDSALADLEAQCNANLIG